MIYISYNGFLMIYTTVYSWFQPFSFLLEALGNEFLEQGGIVLESFL